MSLRSLLTRPGPRPTARRSRRPATCRLAVEPLEDRRTPAAWISIGDATVVEGNDGTRAAAVPVTVSGRHTKTVSVNYRTADESAVGGTDYDAASGVLTFARHETTKWILVPVRGDRLPERTEHLAVWLSDPKGAALARRVGSVAIDDDEPWVSVSDAGAWEGNSGPAPLAFTVRLSAAYDLPVTVTYATADGTATAGGDYAAAAGTLTFAPGQTTQTVAVAAAGDRAPEADENFLIHVGTTDPYAALANRTGVGRILDDEPRITISDVSGSGDSSPFTFTVSLRTAYDEAVTVDFATADGTAFAGVDYVATAGTLTFAPGETTKTITVEVLDPTPAPDKYLRVHLTGASANATVVTEWAYGWWYYDYGSGYCPCEGSGGGDPGGYW